MIKFAGVKSKYFTMNLKYPVAAVLACIALYVSGKDNLTIVEADSYQPIAGVTVMSRSGNIVGITDDKGRISIDLHKDYPLTVRSLGYESMTVSEHRDTLELPAATYTLSEVVVNPVDRPVARVICYAREYCSGTTSTDTMQMYCEYMTESFLTDGGKVKGYDKYDSHLRPRAVRRYARFVKADGTDSVACPSRNDDITFLSFIENIAYVPGKTVTVGERIKAGARTDTLQGKYSPKCIYRKNNSTYTITKDMLSDHKEHRWSPFFFKLLGITMEIQQAENTVAYLVNDTDKLGMSDFVYGTYNLHAVCKGRWLKKLLGTKEPFELDCYIELYPVDIEHFTVEEYKQMKEDYSPIEFREPQNLQPLAPSIRTLVDRVKATR